MPGKAFHQIFLSRALWIGVLTLPLGATACTPPGMLIGLASQPKQNTTQDMVTLNTRPADFIDGASEVGKSLGYRVAGMNRSKNEIAFTASSNMLVGTLFTGKHVDVQLGVELRPDSPTVDLQMVVVGNLKSANQDKVQARLDEFKKALQARFNAS